MADLQRSDVLFVPNRRRLTHAMLAGPEGKEALHIFYGAKEIVFREPSMMPFGHSLLTVERFRAEEATSWSGKDPYDWDQVRGMLEALLSEEILKRFDSAQTAVTVRTFPARLGRAPEDRKPETYSSLDDTTPSITARTVGRAMELSNLEVVVPVHRVAHPALDEDGRQVGENNVNNHLYLDLPTERKLCNYAGTRYQYEKPINSTALKAMMRRWPELLSLTAQFRAAFIKRIPLQAEHMSGGELQLLCTACAGAVASLLVRGENAVPNGKLDGGLAGAIRLIDGVRITTTQMIRDTAGNHTCDRPATGKSVGDYAEQNALFLDMWGVCAGPQVLVDEYLNVLVDGVEAPIQAQPDFAARVGELDAGIDYGLHALRNESIMRAYGTDLGFMHERLHAAFVKHGAPPSKLRELLEIPIDPQHYSVMRTAHPLHETMEMEFRVSRWMFERAGAGLPKGILGSIDDLRRIDLAPWAANKQRLAEFLLAESAVFTALPEPLREEVLAVAIQCLALDRVAVRAVEYEQQQINDCLKRKPGRPLSSDDLAAYTRRSTPVLPRVLAEGLGIGITTSAKEVTLSKDGRTVSLG
jgi:hypothetical protein